jgi:predicted exporter
MDDDKEHPPHTIGWLRAILTALVITIVGLGLLVYGSNAVMTKIHGKTRGSLVGIVTTFFFIVLIAMAWGLRQLQRRKII